MAKFHLNQQVRLVYPRLPENKGITGRIVKWVEVPKGTVVGNGVTDIDCDCEVERDDGRGKTLCAISSLEPVLPKHEPGSWEEIQKLMAGEEEVFPT